MQRIKFGIEFLDSAKKDFKNLQKNCQQKINLILRQKLTLYPEKFGKPLQYSFKGHRRLRIEDYRIIYKIDERKSIVYIVKMAHRKNVYD